MVRGKRGRPKKGTDTIGENPIGEMVGLEQLGELVGLSQFQVKEYQKDGVFFRDENTKKFDTRKNILSIIRHYRDKTSGSDTQRLRKAKADLAEVELFERRGELITLDNAKERAIDVFGALSRDLEELPMKVAPQLNPTDPQHAYDILNDEIKRVFKNCRTRIAKRYKMNNV